MAWCHQAINHSVNIKYSVNLDRNTEYVCTIRNWHILLHVFPAQCLRAGWAAAILKKFSRGSNLVLVFEAVQSRLSTTFPESWHDYPEWYFGSFGWGMRLPGSLVWYRQNCETNKWQVWIREAFLGQILASSVAMTLLAKHSKLIIL